jgi:hypothetical protein
MGAGVVIGPGVDSGQERNMITRPVSSLPAGVPFARFLAGLRFGVGYAAQFFKDSPQVEHALELKQKAAVGGIVSGDSPDLQSVGVFDAATAQLLAGHSAIEAASSRMRRVPFLTKTPKQLDSGSGGNWADEGSSLPIVAYAFDYLKFSPVRLGSVFVASDELVRDRSAEAVLLATALAAQGRTESRLFLDPSLAAVGNAPASICFNALEITPTASMSADLALMVSAIQTSGRGLTWLLRLPDLAYITASLGAAAADVPRSLLGIPCLICANAPAKQITLCDLQEVAFASGPLDAELSTEATLEMESEPTSSISAGSPAAPVATEVISLFQSNSAAYKLSRSLNWQVVRDGAVAFMVLPSGSPA